MKKQGRLISLILSACFLMSAAGISASGAEAEPLIDLDVSGYLQSEMKGVTNQGSSQTAAVAVTSDSAAAITKHEFVNVQNQSVPYLTIHGAKQKERALRVADTALANRSYTAEFWVKRESTQWSYFLSLLGFDGNGECYAEQSVYIFSSDHNALLIRAGSKGSQNGAGNWAKDEWLHLVVTRSLTESGANTKTAGGLYFNGVNYNDSNATAETVTESSAGVIVGAYAQTDHVCSSISVASLKIYDGILTADEMKAHYAAEKDMFVAAAAPEITAVSPADGSEIYTHGAAFTLDFNTVLDEATLAEGIVLQNSAGERVSLDALTLSTDGKSVKASVSRLEADTYTLSVTEKLTSIGGLACAPSAYTYQAKRMNLTADFNDLAVWGDWAVGEEKSATELAAKTPWLKGQASVNGAYGVSRFMLTEDGGLTFRWTDGAGTSTYQSQMYIQQESAVTCGTVVYTFNIKHGPQKGGSTRQCVYIMGETGKTQNTVEPMGTALRNGSTQATISKAQADSDGYFPLQYVLTSDTPQSDWQYTVYCGEKSIMTGTLSRSEFGGIGGIRLYNYADGGNETVTNDITIKNVRAEYIGAALQATAGDYDAETQTLPLIFNAAPSAVTEEQLCVKHENGALVNCTVQRGASPRAYVVSFPFGLPFDGTYTLQLSGLTYADSAVTFDDTVTFTGQASPTALYNIRFLNEAGEEIRVLDDAASLTISYQATGVSGNERMLLAAYGESVVQQLRSAPLQASGSVTVPIAADTKQVKAFVWNLADLRPVFRAQTIGVSQSYQPEPSPLRISGAVYNVENTPIAYLEGQNGITAKARLSAGEPPENLTAVLTLLRGTTAAWTDSAAITFDSTGRADVALGLQVAAQSGDTLLFTITDGTTTYFKKTIGYENPANIVDVLLVIGQSNALGQGGNAYESLKPETGTVYYNTMGDTTLSTSGNAGWDSALAKTWHEQTGRTVLLVKAAWGGTGFPTKPDMETGVPSQWGSSTYGYWNPGNSGSLTEQPYDCYTLAKNRYAAAVSSIDRTKYTVGRCVYFWNQGENENGSYTAQMYEEAFLQLHEKLITEFGTEDTRLTCGGILPVRSSYSKGFPNLQLTGPRVAQYHMGKTRTDLQIVMDATEYWNSDTAIRAWFRKTYANAAYPGSSMPSAWSDIMNTDNVHYKQLAMNEFGIEAAENMLTYLGGGNAADGIDLITPSGLVNCQNGGSITLTQEGAIPVLPASCGQNGSFAVSGTAAVLNENGVLVPQKALQNDYAVLTVSVAGQADMTFRVYSPLRDESISIAPVPDNKSAIYTLTTDDNYAETQAFLNTKLRALGLKGTMGLIADYMGQSGKMTWDEAAAYVADGDTWGVANHTKAHKQSSFASLSATELETEINGGRAALRQHFPTEKILGLYTPGGITSSQIVQKAAEQHACLRLAGGGNNPLPMTESGLYSLSARAVGNWVNTTAAQMNGWLDSAISGGEWLVEMWHGIGENDAAGWGGNISEAAANTHLEYVAQKNNEGLIWVTTLDEACVYAMQRLKSRLSLLEKTDSSITFVLTDDLDDTLYDAALTVNIILPDGWTNAAASQNGQMLKTTVAEGRLSLTIRPDSGSVTVIKQ